MYIQANQCEREVSIHKITNPEHAILDVIRELYDQLRDIESYDDEDDIKHLDIDLDIVFNNEDIQSPAYPENYENLQKLKYCLQFPIPRRSLFKIAKRKIFTYLDTTRPNV